MPIHLPILLIPKPQCLGKGTETIPVTVGNGDCPRGEGFLTLACYVLDVCLELLGADFLLILWPLFFVATVRQNASLKMRDLRGVVRKAHMMKTGFASSFGTSARATKPQDLEDSEAPPPWERSGPMVGEVRSNFPSLVILAATVVALHHFFWLSSERARFVGWS